MYQFIGLTRCSKQLALLATWICMLIPFINGQSEKAIIVGIGNYPTSSGFRKISSLNDVLILKSTLISLGVKEKNIEILVDSQATKKKIVEALEKNIQYNLKPGDIFYFHFSGHGQQVQDLNGDELDGFDESIVPYDAKSEYVSGVYEGQNHLLDDDLGDLFNKVRIKLGPKGHFLTCIDACHSGTATRNIGISRGVDVAMASPEYMQNMVKKVKELSQAENNTIDESKMASMVGFFASMANQLNYEIRADDGTSYGALSYAFCKSVRELSKGVSYQQLFDRIRIQIQTYNNSQTPEAIGTLSQTFFDGKILTSVKYYLIKEFVNSNSVIVNAGFLEGLRPGTIVGLYTPESRDQISDSLIATAVVESSQFNSSQVYIKKGISKTMADKAWVKIREDNFGDLKINLKINGDYAANVKSAIDSILKLPYINCVDKNPDLLILELNNMVHVLTFQDVELMKVSAKSTEKDIFNKLKSAVSNYGQAQFIKKIVQENKDINLEFEILPVIRGSHIKTAMVNHTSKSVNDRIVFKVGDSIQIKVVNKGTKPAYYTLIDIQPNYRINVLIPGPRDSPSDFYLEPGQEYKIPILFKLDPPIGQELFKLLASRIPINLRQLEQKRGIEDEQDPFTKVIQMSYYNNSEFITRGYKSQVPIGQVNIFSIPFEIEEQ